MKVPNVVSKELEAIKSTGVALIWEDEYKKHLEEVFLNFHVKHENKELKRKVVLLDIGESSKNAFRKFYFVSPEFFTLNDP